MRRQAYKLLAIGSIVLTACTSDAEHTLVVLTTFGDHAREAAERAFTERQPEWRVRFVEVDPEEGAGLSAEDGGTRGDVWWGIPVEELAGAAASGILAPTAPSWAERVMAGASDPEGRWHATALSPIVLAFNRDVVPLSRAPRDWIDLFHPRWRGDLALPDGETTPTMRALIAGGMVQEIRRVSVEQAGYDWLLRLDAAAAGYREDERELLRDIRTGGSSFAVLPAHLVATVDEDWLVWRVMESGVPFLAKGVAAVADTAHAAAARDFVEIAGDVAVLAAVAEGEAWVPALEGVTLPSDPYRGRADGLVLWPLAPDTTLTRTAEWVDRWGETVRHKGRTYY